MIELYVSDIHYRYEEPQAEDLLLQVATSLKPDILFLGGDILDFYAVSTFNKDPRRKLQLQEELDYTSEHIQALLDCSQPKEAYFQPGNHEARLQKYLWSRAPELAGLRSLDLMPLLGLGGVTFLAEGSPLRIGELYHIHGHELSGGAAPAKTIYSKAPGNIICGHYHKIEVHYHRTLAGKTHGVWTNGCLCTLTPEYLMFPQWTQGFSVIDYSPSGFFHVDQIPLFLEGDTLNCMVRGQLFTARKGDSICQTPIIPKEKQSTQVTSQKSSPNQKSSQVSSKRKASKPR